MLLAILILTSVFAQGCGGRRVVIVPQGEPVQLAESVKARVYVTVDGGCRKMSKNKVEIPEGWYCLPDPGE
jgi:hypothetical protein